MPETAIDGGCLCGAVRYRAVGPPTVSMICHCDSCARASGAPAVAWVTFATQRFRFLRGEPAAFHSSPPVTRRFCGTCGTGLTYAHSARPSEIDVTTRTLDDPERFPPTHHSWIGDAPRWGRPADGLPAFEGSKT
jgi:hypothetical protein